MLFEQSLANDDLMYVKIMMESKQNAKRKISETIN